MRRHFIFALSAFLGSVLLVGLPWASATDKNESPNDKSKQSTAENKEHVVHQVYLGVGIAPVYPGQEKNSPEKFRKGQGVLVTAVAADSPAEKAGIKPGDIIMSYDDQMLFAPRQFVELVRTDKAKREVNLSFVRDGKEEKAKATLEGHDIRFGNRPLEDLFGRMQREPMLQGRTSTGAPRPANSQNPSGEADKSWDTFDSMTLQNLGKGKFKANIQYMNENGKLEKQQFEGTLKDIRKDILAKKDMPPVERDQLLRSFDMPPEEFEQSELPWMPGMNGEDFDQSGSIF